MNCDLARTEMIAFLQGELPAEQQTALELHLAGCPDCRVQLEQARRLLQWTRAASDESVVGMVDEILLDAIETGASDIHLDPQTDNALRVRYRIDGVLRQSISLGIRHSIGGCSANPEPSQSPALPPHPNFAVGACYGIDTISF